MLRSRTLVASLLVVTLVTLGGCPRKGRDEAKPDEAPTDEAKPKKAKKVGDADPCLGGARPPTWKAKRVTVKEPKIELEYPEFESACTTVAQDLSAAFENQAKTSRADFEKQWREAKADPATFNLESWELVDKCTAAHVSATIVSFACAGSEYVGGAHGMYGTGGHSYVIDGRRVRELKLEELFDGEKSWKKQLGARVAKKINVKKKAEGWDPIAGDAVEGVLSTFTLGDAEISLYFAPYALGSFAEGEYVATFRYEDLDDLLAKEGPASKLPRAASKDPPTSK